MLMGSDSDAVLGELKNLLEGLPFEKYDPHFVLGTTRSMTDEEVKQTCEERRLKLAEKLQNERNYQKIIGATAELELAKKILVEGHRRMFYDLSQRVNREFSFVFRQDFFLKKDHLSFFWD